MINVKELIGKPELVEAMKNNIKARQVDADVDQVVELYTAKLKAEQELEALRAQANKNAELIKSVPVAEKPSYVTAGRELKQQIAELTTYYNSILSNFNDASLKLPNWMSPDVPVGNSDADNKIFKTHLEPGQFDFKPMDHVELGRELDLIDFEAGAKVTGPKFYFLKREGVLLQHAIKSFAFKKAIEHGFIPLQTPDLARNGVLQGIGFAPRGAESNTYELNGEDLSLIATAEIAVGGMHASETFDPQRLPLLYVAESHCFRREAGTAGRASKGLYRVHQFEKIELFAFCTPEQSDGILEQIRELEESIYQALGIPYHIVLNCSADLGAPAYKKYDIEAWMPGKGEEGEYGEITSASNCTTYQARRLNIRYKNGDTGKNEFLHTLNGTAVALSRTTVAIMENYQTAEGGIKIPDALVPYMPMDYIAPRNKG
ncbi:MAG: serine--tRNA ligase [Williamsia sp.]|nr:serine--tRNA ligase [Williamsia sp.]